MARIRTIKPGFFIDDVVGELTHLQRLIFIGLWTLADRDGRLEDKPLVIRAQLLPYEAVDMNVELSAIAAKGMVRRYVVAGKRYIEVTNFSKHQVPNHREPSSIFPGPSEADTVGPVRDPALPGQKKADPVPPERNGSGEREGNGDPELRSGTGCVLPLPLVLEESGSGSDAQALSDDTASKVRSVFEHYRGYHPRAFPSPKSDSAEWRKIKARMAEGYSADDLKAAIDGYHRSPYHCGENDGNRRYLDLELFVRDGTHVAKGIELGQRAPPVVRTEKEIRGVRAAVSWVERKRGNGDG